MKDCEYSQDEVIQILRNVGGTSARYTLYDVLGILRWIGQDVECATCMSIAFCGFSLPGDKHTCGKATQKVTITIGPGNET